MSNENSSDATPHGYLSEGSKGRFTLVAGVLGAVFFIAQFALPFIIMFLFMMPMMFGSLSTADMDHAALWQGDLWFVERAVKLNWHDAEASTESAMLRHLDPKDLSESGPPVSLGSVARGADDALVPVGDRLWIIGARSVRYYEHGVLTALGGGARPKRASAVFVYLGRPAVVTTGTHPSLAILDVADGVANWSARDLPLALPPEGGSLRTLQALEVGGRLYLFAELCTEDPEACGISYREVDGKSWIPLAEDGCSCASWTALQVDGQPGLVIFRRDGERGNELTIAKAGADGPKQDKVPLSKEHAAWKRWHPVSLEKRLFLLSQGMPGGLSLIEIAESRVVRSLERGGAFPFGPHMMLLMVVPQAMPALLSLILAFVLTTQMRRHRVQVYAFEEERRSFASLWQRALAQLIDIVPLGAGFALPGLFMWRLFSHPESLVDEGPYFPLWIFGFIAAAFLSALLVLVAYSYFEGRFGKTPGKWLLRIRVLGTDLRPCGFGRALLRNVLTFVDGFFNFLVGALLVALTENWQRLGDLAARTIVVVDEKTP